MRIPVYERRANISPLSMPNEQPHPLLSDNGQNVSQTLSDTFARLQKFTDDLEDTQTLEAFNKFKLDSQDYHENPDTGILHTRLGGKSFGLYHDADEWLRKKGEDYARELPSDRAKRNFRKMAREHIQQRGVQNSRFEADQMKKYRQETADAAINNSLIFAERNWDKLEAIEQARSDIAQALELKMRGSSPEAFKHAWAEIEDQLGVARIRQAFVFHPLTALDYLKRKDIHLKPETRAKLVENLKNRTEIFRMQGYVEQYATLYSPEQAVELKDILISRLGVEEGEKAFAAVSRQWSIQNTQKAARKQALLEEQQHNEDSYLKKLNDIEHNPIDTQQIIKDMLDDKIRPEFAYTVLARLDARRKQAEAEKRKNDKDFADIVMWGRETRHEYFTDDELTQLVTSKVYTDDDARRHQNARETYIRRQAQEQKQAETERLQKAKDDFASKFYQGSLTVEDIDVAVDNNALDPNDAITIRNMLRSEQERKERGEKLQTKQQQEEYEKGLRIIVNNGGIIPHKQVNELLDRDMISKEFAQYLYNHEDNYYREQERLQKDAERAQKAADKEKAAAQTKADEKARKNELDQRASQLAKMYPLGHEGEGYEFIQKLGLDVDEQKFLHERYSSYIQDAKAAKKNADDQQEAMSNQVFQYMKTSAIAAETQAEVDELRKGYELIYSNGDLEKTRYDELIGILNDKERIFKEVAKQKERADNYDIARDYFSRFGIDNIHTARQELRQKYPDREKVDDIISKLDKLAQEAREEKNDEAKALREQQEQTFTDLKNQYWRNGKSVPNDELARLEQSKGLTPEQVENAYRINHGMQFKKEVEYQLSQNPDIDFAGKSPAEREALVMRHMGISQEQRADNVAYLLKKVLDGTSSNSEIDAFETVGYISASDKDYIKGVDSKFDRIQKGRLRDTSRRMGGIIRDLYNNKSKEYSQILREAQDKFLSATFNIDPRAKDFDKAVTEIVQRILGEVADEFANSKDLTDWFWPFTQPSAAALRLQTGQQKIENFSLPPMNTGIPFLDEALGLTMSVSPTGQITSYDNSAPALPQVAPPPPPEPSLIQRTGQAARNFVAPRAAENVSRDYIQYSNEIGALQIQGMNLQDDNVPIAPPAEQKPMNLGLAMIANGTVTGHFSDWRAYRNGQHNGIDIAGRGNITLPQTNIPLSVSKVNTKSPHKGGGNSVTLSGTDSNGDKWDFIISHMENNSIALNVGDVVLPGDVIGKVGNTGMTSDREKGGITAWYDGKKSGYHMDLKIKKNGKYIDPETFTPPPPTAMRPGPTIQRAQFLPQPLEEPDIMSDEEMYQAALEFLGLGGGLFGDISGDISTRIPYGGNF